MAKSALDTAPTADPDGLYQLLIEAHRFFLDRLRESLRTVRLDHEVPEAGPAAHRAVLDAIVAQDAAGAARAAAAVVEPTLAVLESLVAGDPPQGTP